ncbi:MAG: TonB-dependent receptor [Bacteroidales bacterium]|nr:TonB-dependent receptor [Bacteroidales bacterium]
MKKTLFFFILGCYSLTLSAQNFTISGYISDTASGEKLIGANVYSKESMKGVVTNNYGFYSFTVNKSTINLSYSFVGYKTQKKILNLTKDTLINISLSSNNELNEVIVMENKLESELKSPQMSVMELPLKELKTLPVLFGETDVLRTLQLMPGVHTGGEGTSGLYVRGGGPDQNLILLDGIQIYNVYHLFGFFSVFNTDAIKNIKLIKGGFPAEYGGRLSSILDIRMKEGNTKKLKGSISLGLIAASFMLEGPIKNENTSFIISARRTYIDILSRPFIKNIADDAVVGYYFYDLTGKINHKFSDKSRLYLSTYIGKDSYTNKCDEEQISASSKISIHSENFLGWANYTAAMRWNYIFGSKLFSNTSITYSNYKYQTGMDNNKTETIGDSIYENNYSYLYNSGIEDISGKIDFEYIPSPNYTLKFGAKYINHTFRPGVSVEKNMSNQVDIPPLDTVYGNNNIYANELAAYIGNTINIGKYISANMGLRISDFYVNGKWYYAFEPRVSIRVLVGSKLSLKASYSVMNQYIHLLTNTSSNMPTDLWLPVTDKVKPQNSVQYAIGSVYNINKQMSVSIETYYKTMDNLIEYAEGSSFYTGFTNWEDMIETGKGWSYGAELFVKKQFGKTTGWLGYTWSKTERQFENINFGEPFPYKYDRRNDLNIAVTHKLKDNIDISATWVYGTGNAFTMPHSQINSTNFYSYRLGYVPSSPLFNFENRNSYRMPSNHRLDFGVNFYKQKKRGKRIWSMGIYNVYNRKNAFYLEYDSFNQQMVAVSIFPILPYVNYKFEF